MAKTYHITAKAIVSVPDDAMVSSRSIQLSDGNQVKAWVTLELNDYDDLTSTQIEDFGIYMEHVACEITLERA